MATMPEQFMKQVTQWWGSLGMNQKIVFILTSLLFVSVLSGSIYWGTRPDYAVLYTNLSTQDASAVVDLVREQKIPYRLSGGGTQVEVPSSQVYDVRLKLAGKGLPRGEGAGFEMFDKMSFGVTDEVQRINYLRALQSELEQTIESLEAIEKCRVHLVIPKEEVWFQEPFAPTASVMLKLRAPGALTPQQGESIRHLLASAVRGLEAERVTIVDTSGKVLSAGGETQASAAGISGRQLEYKTKIEENMKIKAESLLQEILGPGKAVVRVEAEVDFDQIVKEREYYEPVVGEKGLVRSEQQMSMTPSQGQTIPAGTAGTASNLQGYPPASMQKTIGSSKNDRFTRYEMNRTLERITTASGTLKKLSVGIFVDGKQKPEALADIQGVLSNALGINEKRGDQITVRAYPFNRKDVEADRELLEKSQKEKFWLTLLTQWVPRGLLIAGALGLLVVGVRVLQRNTDRLIRLTEDKNNGNGQNLDADRILALMKQNPAETGQVLKHWLS